MKEIQNSEALLFWKITGFWALQTLQALKKLKQGLILLNFTCIRNHDTALLTPEYTFM